MKKRNIFISAALLLVVIAASGFLYVQQTLKFPPLPAYNTSIISGKPEGADCINESRSARLAIELIDLGVDKVYLAGGRNPISEEAWDNTIVRFPQMKNSKRYLLFDDSCLYRSPEVPAECQGDECATFVEFYDHTWFVLNTLAGQGCYPDAGGCNLDVVEPGYVSITTIDKCQEITFSGPVVYELVDERGNRYVMHATDDGQPDVEGVVLPAGWSLSEVQLEAPLVIQPRGEGHCYYNILRDENLQSYHQYYFVDEVFPSLVP